MPDTPSAIRKPSVEQLVYYMRLAESDDHTQREARQRDVQEALRSLVAHLEGITGNHVEWRMSPRQTADPYVSQPIANIGWLLGEDGQRAYWAKARTYGDGYILHVRYLRRGEWPNSVFANIMREDVWHPPSSEALFGQQLVFSSIARPEDHHPLAAQILRLQMPPRKPIGELQTCGLSLSRIFRGSANADLSVFLYAQDDLEWAVDHFTIGWLPRWEYHYRKLNLELAWCADVTKSLEQQASQLREAIRRGQLQSATGDKWEEAVQRFADQLAVLLRREKAIQSNLENLKWLLGQLKIVGPDTYLASALRALRGQSQEVVNNLAGWQRTRDEAISTLSASAQASLAPARGDLSRLWLNSQRPQPVLEALRAAREMPPWPSQGWINAQAVHLPDNPDAVPNWRSRRYDLLHLAISGPRTDRGFAIDVYSSSLGQFAGTLASPTDSPEFQAYLEATRSGRVDTMAMRAMGEILFRALMGLDRETIYRKALELARVTGHGLALRLSLARAAELEALPWECLYDPAEDLYLAASGETPLARVTHPAALRQAGALDPPLRVLYALSTPRDAASRFGLPEGQAGLQATALRERLHPLQQAGHLIMETMRVVTRSSLSEAITRLKPHVVHLCALGVSRNNEPHLLLQNASRNGRLASPRLIQEIVATPETRLLVLTSPDSTSLGPNRTLLQVAEQIRDDAPFAILAPQHALLSGEFFWELVRASCQGTALDVAVAEARRRILMESGGESRGWESPVLFLPTLSGQLLNEGTKGEE